MKAEYRIQNADGTFLNAGTGLDSWFTEEEVRKIVKEGQKVLLWGEIEALINPEPATPEKEPATTGTTQPTTEEAELFPMVKGEGAPQYTFLPAPETQLAMF